MSKHIKETPKMSYNHHSVYEFLRVLKKFGILKGTYTLYLMSCNIVDISRAKEELLDNQYE